MTWREGRSLLSQPSSLATTWKGSMRKRKKTEITVEIDEVFVVRRSRPITLAWCVECNEQVRIVTPDEAAEITGASLRAIYRVVDAGSAHFTEMPEGLVLVCLNSLSRLKDQ